MQELPSHSIHTSSLTWRLERKISVSFCQSKVTTYFLVQEIEKFVKSMSKWKNRIGSLHFPVIFIPYCLCFSQSNGLSYNELNTLKITFSAEFKLNPSRRNPRQSAKTNLNFYFLTSLWNLKRFYEGLSEMHGTGRVKIPNLSRSLTLLAPTPQIGQTHSNNPSANCRQIVWVCLTIFGGWRLKG